MNEIIQFWKCGNNGNAIDQLVVALKCNWPDDELHMPEIRDCETKWNK